MDFSCTLTFKNSPAWIFLVVRGSSDSELPMQARFDPVKGSTLMLGLARTHTHTLPSSNPGLGRLPNSPQHTARASELRAPSINMPLTPAAASAVLSVSAATHRVHPSKPEANVPFCRAHLTSCDKMAVYLSPSTWDKRSRIWQY